MTTAEQDARDMLEQCGVEDAQSFSAGDVIALANLIAEHHNCERKFAAIRHRCADFTPDPNVVDEVLAIIDGMTTPSYRREDEPMSAPIELTQDERSAAIEALRSAQSDDCPPVSTLARVFDAVNRLRLP